MFADQIPIEDDRYNVLYNNAPTSFQTLGADGDIKDVNKTWQETFGFKAKQVNGESFYNYLHKDDSTVFKYYFELLKKNECPNNVRCRIKHNNGHYCETIIQSLGSGQTCNSKEYYFVIKTDKGRSKPEIYAKENIAKYQAIFNGVNEAIFLHDPQTLTIWDANQKAAELYGYSVDEFRNNNFSIFDITAPEQNITPDFVTKSFHKVNTGESFAILWKAKRKDGSTFWVEVSPKLIFIEGEKQIMASVQDITDRLNTEKELRERERKYRLLAEHSSDVIAALDSNLKPIYISPSAQTLYGYSESDFLHKSIFDIVYKDDLEALQVAMQEHINKKDKQSRLTFRIYTKEYNVKWIEAISNYFYDKSGEIERIIINERDITDRKKLEDRLKQAEKVKSLILNSTKELVVYYSPDFKIKWANKASADSVSMSTDDLVGEYCYSIWHGREEPCTDCPLIKVLKTGKYQEGEVNTPNGRYWFLRGYPILDETGNIKGLVEFGQDITEEKLLKDNEKQHRIMLDMIANNTGSIIFLLKVEGKDKYRYQFINETFFQITGYKKSQFMGKLLEEVMPEDTLDLELKKYREAIAQKQSTQWEEQMPTHYGNKTGLVTLTPIFDSACKCTYIVGHITDISGKLKTERILREKEQVLKTVIEQMPMAVFAHDLEGRFVLVNKAAEKDTGYSRDELLSMKVSDIDQDSATRNDQQHIWKELEFGSRQHITTYHRKKEGKTYPVEIFITATVLKNRPVLIAMAQDISERLENEKVIKEREEQLRKANETKDKFFSIIAHDLRNPFNSLVGISELLIDHIEEGDIQNLSVFLKILHNTAIQGTNLLDNLLTWSRSQSGTIQFNPKYINLKELVDESLMLLENVAHQKQLRTENSINNNLIIYGDLDMLRTILRNLITNALKYTANGGFIQIFSECFENCYFVYVKDSGVGMDDAVISKLFKAGENISTAGTNDEKGTGLGLILCKEFVDKHGGEIGATSEPGKGSTFWFSIPNKADNKGC